MAPGHLGRLGDQRTVANRLHHDVGAATVVARPNPVAHDGDRIDLSRIMHVVNTAAFREVQAHFRDIEGDDLGAGELEKLRGKVADEAEADDRDPVSCLHR